MTEDTETLSHSNLHRELLGGRFVVVVAASSPKEARIHRGRVRARRIGRGGAWHSELAAAAASEANVGGSEATAATASASAGKCVQSRVLAYNNATQHERKRPPNKYKTRRNQFMNLPDGRAPSPPRGSHRWSPLALPVCDDCDGAYEGRDSGGNPLAVSDFAHSTCRIMKP